MRRVLGDLRVAFGFFHVELAVCSVVYEGGTCLSANARDEERECDTDLDDDELGPWPGILRDWFAPEGWRIGTECYGNAVPGPHRITVPPRGEWGRRHKDPTADDRKAARARLRAWIDEVAPVVGAEAAEAARAFLRKRNLLAGRDR